MLQYLTNREKLFFLIVPYICVNVAIKKAERSALIDKYKAEGYKEVIKYYTYDRVHPCIGYIW